MDRRRPKIRAERGEHLFVRQTHRDPNLSKGSAYGVIPVESATSNDLELLLDLLHDVCMIRNN